MAEQLGPVLTEVSSAFTYAIVPTNPERPVLGPFNVRDAGELKALQAYTRDKLGLAEEGYSLRPIAEGDDAAFFAYQQGRPWTS